MNARTFLKEARAKISDNPLTRLGPVAQSAIANPNCIFDVHCHIFDRKCLSVLYITLRMARSAIADALGIESDDDLSEKIDLLKKDDDEMYALISKNLPETAKDWDEFEKEINAIQELEKYELFGYKWSDLKQAIDVIKKDSMGAVFELYMSKYGLNKSARYQTRPLVAGILSMDLETGWDMQPKKSYLEQIIELQNLATTQTVLPFLAVDPRRTNLTDPNKDLYSLFLKAFTEGPTPFFGVKCYPALGYLPSDKRLEPIFQICEEKNIPVTAHCGGTMISTFETTIKVRNEKGKLIDFKIPGENRKERADFLNNPAQWDAVLEKHKSLKVNLAHFGGDTNWEELVVNDGNERINKIVQMMANTDLNVYTDFSYNLVEDDLLNKLGTMLQNQPKIQSKVLFGTDFWVALPSGDLVSKQNEFIEHFNAFERAFTVANPRDFLFKETFKKGDGGIIV
jgi:Amidohydrolase